MSHSTDGNWQRLGDGSLITEDAAEGLGHIVEFKVYLKVLVALLILTVVTVIVSLFDFGAFNIVVAIGIASVKAGLVAAWFMHLRFENKLVILFAVYPLLILTLLIGGSLGDVATRDEIVKTEEVSE